MTPDRAPTRRPRRDTPAHRNHLAHTFACPDCQRDLPCRTERALARRADIESGHLIAWPAGRAGVGR